MVITIRIRVMLRAGAHAAAFVGCWAIGSVVGYADSQLAPGGTAQAHVTFRIDVPQTVELSVVDRRDRAPVLRVGPHVLDADGRPEVPAGRGEPLARCRFDVDGRRWCSVTLP